MPREDDETSSRPVPELTHEQAFLARCLLSSKQFLRDCINASCIFTASGTIYFNELAPALEAYNNRWEMMQRQTVASLYGRIKELETELQKLQGSSC